mgnify:CR=1 FL=1
MSELAEGARLEIACTTTSGTEGSNPSLSATLLRQGFAGLARPTRRRLVANRSVLRSFSEGGLFKIGFCPQIAATPCLAAKRSAFASGGATRPAGVRSRFWGANAHSIRLQGRHSPAFKRSATAEPFTRPYSPIRIWRQSSR